MKRFSFITPTHLNINANVVDNLTIDLAINSNILKLKRIK